MLFHYFEKLSISSLLHNHTQHTHQHIYNIKSQKAGQREKKMEFLLKENLKSTNETRSKVFHLVTNAGSH